MFVISFFTETSSRPAVNFETRSAEIFIFVENMAANLVLSKATTHALHSQDGFQEIADLITKGICNISNFNVIILLLGRADLWSSDRVFRTSLAACLAAIRKVNLHAFIVMCAIIPAPGDTLDLRKTAGYRHGYMSYLAGDSNRLEFSKPGKHLLQGGSAIKHFYDGEACLTERGLDIIARALEAKIRCASVFRKFDELLKTE